MSKRFSVRFCVVFEVEAETQEDAADKADSLFAQWENGSEDVGPDDVSMDEPEELWNG